MLEYLKRIIERVRRRGPRFPPFGPFDDPDAGVRQPKRNRGPSRTMAVAVDEPDDSQVAVAAIGRDRRP